MKQLVQPKLTTKAKAGWCLWHVQEDYGVPHMYDFAADNNPNVPDAWSLCQLKHVNEQPPSDVCVPVFTTYTEGGVEMGHIAISVPGRGIFSSPMDVSYGNQWFASVDAMVARIKQLYSGCTYLGWSEDLSGVQLVTKEDEMVQDTDNEYGRWRKAFYQIRGRDANRQEFKNAAVGRTWLNALEILSDDPEADSSTNNQEVGKVAIQDNWQGQIYDLQARTAELGKSVTIKDDEIKKLTAQLAVQSGDTQLLNGFGAWLTKIIVRLGLKG